MASTTNVLTVPSSELAQQSSQSDVIWIALFLLLFLAGLVIAFAFGWWMQRQKDSVSPYTGSPLRRAETLTFYAKEQILRFLYEHHSYDNRMFKLKRAAFCRETGRIFPHAVTWYDTIKLDWSFIQKRLKGNYVSWGSLSHEQQVSIRKVHASLRGFQTSFSSKRPSPRDVEPDYALSKPGPLYVDLDSKALLGWKVVPGTDFEVFIVQKPIKLILTDAVNE